ncbi:MAG: adenosine deaminase, partial [Gemmatimonadales bacterium]
MTVTRAWVTALPKAELHVHLDGCLRPSTMLELAERAGVALPARNPSALADFMLVRDARNLSEYLQRFETTLSVMQSAEAMERIAFEFVEDVAAEGIRYVEVRFCPALHPGVGSEAALEAALAGLARGARATGARANTIVCGLRTLDPSVSLAMAELAVRWLGRGVVAFDLAGNEAGHPASVHAEAFHVARAGGLALTCHAGEGAGPASIREALDVCGAQRIGHGVRLKEDQNLYDRVRSAGVPLEIYFNKKADRLYV